MVCPREPRVSFTTHLMGLIEDEFYDALTEEWRPVREWTDGELETHLGDNDDDSD